jgi:hypothetical protein
MKATTRHGQKEDKCMNHDPEASKWGQYAPSGGCTETLFIDEKSTAGLCWRCTSSSVTNLSGTQYREQED